MIHYVCRKCKEEMASPSCMAGELELCPSCGQRNRVPNPPASTLDAPEHHGTRDTPGRSGSKPVLVVIDHPYEEGRGLRYHLYECAGVKSGQRSGCKVEPVPLREAEAEGRTICALCAEGRTDDPFSGPSEARCDAVMAKWPEFAALRFGNDPPTIRQFTYAVALGIKVKDGVSFKSISRLIETAKAKGTRPQRDTRPSDQEAELIYQAIEERGPSLACMLQTIAEYHGVLSREVSLDEARSVIEFLEDYYLPCPFCGSEVAATDDECCGCGKSLRRMRIPITL